MGTTGFDSDSQDLAIPRWTVEKIAEAVGAHPETIKEHIRQGKLRAYKIAGVWRIYDDDLNVYFRRSPSVQDRPASPIPAQRSPRRRRL